MKIRQEKPAEYQAVERLTYQAFKELNLTENWRPTEHFIVHLLRERVLLQSFKSTIK